MSAWLRPDDPPIVHVAPFGADPVNGVLVAAVRLAAELAATGLPVELWQPHPWPAAGFAEHEQRLDEAGVVRVVLDPDPPARPLLRRAAVRAAADRPATLVHLHSVYSPHVTQLARALAAPLAVSPHGGYAPAARRRRRLRKAVYGALFDRPMLRRAAVVCALTDTEAAEVGRYGVAAQTRVVPNGVDPPPTVDAGAFRAELGLAAEQPLAVYAGRLDPYHKGLDRLVAGLATAPDWLVAFVGPDDRGGQAALERLAAEAGVAARVRFTGGRRGVRLHEAYAAADVFCLPSRWEGLPLTLLEALSHGVPAVVSAPVDVTVGVVAAGAGWLAEADHVGDALRAVSAAPAAERAARGTAARELAARFSWSAVAGELSSTYAAALTLGH